MKPGKGRRADVLLRSARHWSRALLIGALCAFASSVAQADGTTTIGTVTFLSTETTGVFVQLRNTSGALVTADPDACGRNYLFMLDKNNAMFNALHAALLAAFNTNTPMYLKLSGCNGAAGNAWPLVSYVSQGQYQPP